MLSDQEYTIAKAKLQERQARGYGGEETERLAAVVKEYEDFKASAPAGLKVSKVDPVAAAKVGKQVEKAKKLKPAKKK